MRLDDESFIERLSEVNPYLEPLDAYTGYEERMRFRCAFCGHVIVLRADSALHGFSCRYCLDRARCSFVEAATATALRLRLGEDAVLLRDRAALGGLELDIYIPESHWALEIGSWFRHSNRLGKDREKRLRCEGKGIELTTVYYGVPQGSELPFEGVRLYPQCLQADKSHIKNVWTFIDGVLVSLSLDALTSQERPVVWDKAYRLTHKDYAADFRRKVEIITPRVELLGAYDSAGKTLKVRCKVCGHEWKAWPVELLNGHGCQLCGFKAAGEKIRNRVQCVETGEVFESVSAAGERIGYKVPASITRALDHPDRLAGGFHWEHADPPSERNFVRRASGKGTTPVKCVETGDVYESLKSACEAVGLKNSTSLCNCLDKPNKVAAGFHWVRLGHRGTVPILCVETGKVFKSIRAAQEAHGLHSSSSIIKVLDDPNRTSAGYHWVRVTDTNSL